MPRIRTIKPDFFTSDTVSELPLRARLTWIGLWTHCDDYGRCRDNVKLIKAAIWPLDNVSLRDIDEDLDTLTARGRLIRYTVDGKNYLAVPTWTEHQRVSHPAKSRIPAPPESALELLQSPPEDFRNGSEDLPSTTSPDPVDIRPEAVITQLNGHSGNSPESSGGFPEASGNPPLGKGKEQGTGKGGENARADGRGSETFQNSFRPEIPPPRNADNVRGVGHHGLKEGYASNADPASPAEVLRSGAAKPEGTTASHSANVHTNGSAPAGNYSPEPRGTGAPPLRCKKHLNDADPPQCGPCGDARKAHQRWESEQLITAKRVASERAHAGAAATAAAIAACDMCDHAGYRPGAVIPCDHDPETLERASRGAALARATLLKGRTA